MADTFTQFLVLTRPEVGASRDSWGEKTNENFNKIDVWAAATDKLAKEALSKEILAAQAIKGPTIFSEAATFTKGLSVPLGVAFNAGKAQIYETADNTTLRLAKSALAVVNEAGSASIFRLFYTNNVASAFIGPNIAWHAGNLTPADYANKVVGAAQTFAGPLAVNRASPTFDLVYPGVINFRQRVLADGSWSLENADNGEGALLVAPAGRVVTKEFGDLNMRIESRSAAYANDRANTALTTARNEFANRLVKTGDIMTGTLGFQADDPTINFANNFGAVQSISLTRAGHVSIKDGAGVENFRFEHLGALWTRQFGDLNTRIESRAAAFADDRLASARAYTDQAFATLYGAGVKEFAGDLRISKASPEMQLLWGGVARWGALIRNNGRLTLRNPDTNTDALSFGFDGSVSSLQFGDLNSRIETRAANFADDRLTIARNEYSRISLRLSFAGDLTPDWNLNGAIAEPFAGAVITTRATTNPGGPIYWTSARWRYAQIRGSDGNWYTAGYV